MQIFNKENFLSYERSHITNHNKDMKNLLKYITYFNGSKISGLEKFNCIEYCVVAPGERGRSTIDID